MEAAGMLNVPVEVFVEAAGRDVRNPFVAGII
jgi:hypothetical protein